MRTNKTVEKRPPVVTHENAPAAQIDAEKMLRRSVMSCFLWEKEFYEDGVEIATRIAQLVPKVAPAKVAAIAVEAREKMKLRHVPLLLVREMARHEKYRPYVADTLTRIIQRADEPAEFLALYWGDKKQPVAHSVRRGLSKALRKFNEYHLAKYRGEGRDIKQRDVFRLVRPVPANEEQAALWKRAVKGELATPDTWEVSLSANDGLSKKAKWERLLRENKLGALALIRNLRNFEKEGVDADLVAKAISGSNVSRVLPFRFIAAARYAPRYETELEAKLFESIGNNHLPGKTVILVDVSGSMEASLSSKSEMTRMDAAAGVAMVGREMCESVAVYTFSNKTNLIASRRGFALRDLVIRSQPHGGTALGKAVKYINDNEKADRLIVITDEQSHDRVDFPVNIERAYMINVASYRNGIGYDKWVHIDGFSEAIFTYILESEGVGANLSDNEEVFED